MEQKPRGVGRPRAFDAQKVAAAMQDVFWRQGFAATSLDDISAATGLHKPSLYGAYGNKRAMFDDSFKAYRRQMRDAMGAGFAKPRLRDALTAVFSASSAIFLGGGVGRGCFMGTAAVPLASSDPAIAETVRRAIAGLEAGFSARLRQAEADGDLSPRMDVETAADLLLGTHLRLSTLARSGATAEELEAVWGRVVRAVVA